MIRLLVIGVPSAVLLAGGAVVLSAYDGRDPPLRVLVPATASVLAGLAGLKLSGAWR